MRRVVRETPLGRVVVEYEDGQMRVLVEPKSASNGGKPEASKEPVKEEPRVVH
jgi:hypothetical protein